MKPTRRERVKCKGEWEDKECGWRKGKERRGRGRKGGGGEGKEGRGMKKGE